MRCFDQFCRDETGSVTMEFVLWVPLIMALLALVVDATTIYVTHTEMENVARDTARRMVHGDLTAQEAKGYAAAAMSLREAPYSVDTDYDESKNVAQVIIRIHVKDATIIGSWALAYPLTLFGGDMSASVVMRPIPGGLPTGGAGGSGGGETGGGETGSTSGTGGDETAGTGGTTGNGKKT